MKRAECEERLKELFDQMVEVYKEYNPEGEYLICSVTDGNYCHIGNEWYHGGKDCEIPINYYWTHEK